MKANIISSSANIFSVHTYSYMSAIKLVGISAVDDVVLSYITAELSPEELAHGVWADAL